LVRSFCLLYFVCDTLTTYCYPSSVVNARWYAAIGDCDRGTNYWAGGAAGEGVGSNRYVFFFCSFCSNHLFVFILFSIISFFARTFEPLDGAGSGRTNADGIGHTVRSFWWLWFSFLTTAMDFFFDLSTVFCSPSRSSSFVIILLHLHEVGLAETTGHRAQQQAGRDGTERDSTDMDGTGRTVRSL